LHILDESGKELITAILRPDEIFGFDALSDSKGNKESATALEKSALMSISLQKLKDFIAINPDLALGLVQVLTENLSNTKDQLLEMAYGSVRKRTAHTLLKFAEKLQKDKHGSLHILRSDLANVAGVATETLIRTLSGFKKEGLIEIEERNIKILDRNGLEKMN
jgi:CRP-like cAMP-binding protein